MVVIVPGSDAGSVVTDYDELISNATEVLGRTPMAAAYTMSVSDINNRLRVREMLVEQTGTNTLPDDFIEADEVSVEGKTYSPAGSYGRTNRTFTVYNNTLVLCPETTDNIFLRYYSKNVILETGESSGILTRYPDVFLYGLLFHHARLVREVEGAASWGQAFADAVIKANEADLMGRMSSIAMQPVARATA